MALVPLTGSERRRPEGAADAGPADPSERIEVTIVVQPAAGPGAHAAALEELARTPPSRRRHLGSDELAAATGASGEALAAVEEFARHAGLEVVASDRGRRSVVAAGPAGEVAAAFGVELRTYRAGSETWRGHEGAVRVPEHLEGTVAAVLGLDERPQARPRLRPAVTPSASYTPVELAALYGFPTSADGTGQAIGIVELGGGYRMEDLRAFFASLGLAAPSVTAVGVDGASNSPSGGSSGPDTEVALDIEVAGAVAPGAAITVYFAPNTDRGFLDALTTAVHGGSRAPVAVSVSWGGPESTWTASSMAAFDQALADAALAGVTVTVAAGDSGSSDGVGDGLAHADFPASSPHALACGGTRLEAASGRIVSEVVWNDGPGGGATGGGVSDVFPLPTWQSGAGVPPSANPGGHVGRGLPDVSGDADPATGYRVRVDGSDVVVGGTSAVAPLWAGLVALLAQGLGHRPGWLNPTLYTSLAGEGALRDITSGSNGAYRAGSGWDACSGWGSPDGARLAAGLAAGPASSAPSTRAAIVPGPETAGRFTREVVESAALAGNPLGDPSERALWVYTPPAYEAAAGAGRRFPVIYVIQGFTGQVDMWWNRSAWKPGFPRMVDDLFAGGAGAEPALVVLVDAWTSLGGSQYLNSSATGRYLDYLADDVVAAVDSRYRTVAEPRGRAVAGKSSGGYGAMVVPMLRPDVFGGGLATHAGDCSFELCYLGDIAAAARALRDDHGGSYEAFWADFRSRTPFSRSSDAALLNVYAMSACYSAEPDGTVTLPFDPQTAALREEVWRRWLARDPLRMAPEHAEALRALRGIWVDAGRRDDYWLDLGAQAFSACLSSLGIEHHFELFEGTHSGIEDRYPLALRYLAERMATP